MLILIFKNTLKNFKNIKSLAKKPQMSIACHWETSHSKCIEYGPMKSINVDNEDYGDVLARALHGDKTSMQLTGLHSVGQSTGQD